MSHKVHYRNWTDANSFGNETICHRDANDVDYTTPDPDLVTCASCRKNLPKALERETFVLNKYKNAVSVHPETGEVLPYGYTWVRNFLYGGWVKEHVMTPYFCSVGSETYWST